MRNIVQKTMTPQSPSKQAPWDLTQFSQSSSAALSYFSESYGQSEISSLSKVILVLGKARVAGPQIWAVEGLSHLSDLMFHQKTLHEMWCMSGVHCRDEAANHQLPKAVSFWIICIVSMEECSSLTQHLMQIHTFKCDGHAVHMLTQQCLPPPLTNTVKSSLLTHVHSSPLS